MIGLDAARSPVELSYTDAVEKGLVRAAHERDACGVAFVADRFGRPSHSIVVRALEALERLAHRGATGADPRTGDGAGILTQIPHEWMVLVAQQEGWSLPAAGHYGLGSLFLPSSPVLQESFQVTWEEYANEDAIEVLGWRRVPVSPDALGAQARESMPSIWQVVVVPQDASQPREALERQLCLLRRRFEREHRGVGGYVSSLSTRTVVYKGLLMADQVATFYPDLRHPSFESALAIVHQRFSTNTLPNWERAQPMRMIAHNGEINTLRGNENWMRAREARMWSADLGGPERWSPVIEPGGSDSAALDNAIELLVRGGRGLVHAVAMALPAAWEADPEMPEDLRGFYAYHEGLMEPWDGPAAVAFTDGRIIGASLDRNGLRPARFTVAKDGLVVMGSEAGLLDLPLGDIELSDQLGPGQRLAVNTTTGQVLLDDAIQRMLAERRPYAAWVRAHTRPLVPSEAPPLPPPGDMHLLQQQQAYGYTQEDVRVLLAPMADSAAEPIGSMGNDASLAVLSDRPLPLFDYFKQLFAQVTNPPIDPLRESLVMSLRTVIGRQGNLLDEGPEGAIRLELPSPVLLQADLSALVAQGPPFSAATISTLIPAGANAELLEAALDALVASALEAARGEATILVLSDQGIDEAHAFIPSLLAVGAVHHGLIRAGLRDQVALVVDSGEPREVMHIALLVGYGAAAVHPRLALHTVEALARHGELEQVHSAGKAAKNLQKALEKGLLKVLSKMGISTLSSYRGAQIFEALGVRRTLVDRYFTGTTTRIEGIALDEIAAMIGAWHHAAHGGPLHLAGELEEGGIYQWRRRGEKHRYDPPSVALLQHAVREGSKELYRRYSAHVDAEHGKHLTLRGLLELCPNGSPIPLEEVEPATEIVRRFKTGAMSFGSISKEAHETLAIAMNRLGGKSNTGEGGEDPERFLPDSAGNSRRSAIKQVASGRFGVTIHYLVNADELQIKMAQGAKPGEGGQLPGHKVDETIARLRYSTPGVGLISPPPHHDIYSIEDLAQLIYDLRNANPAARISVKLVSETGVGTVASGVAKAGADLILISGGSGGTGASPLSSIRHAGLPWELGLAETQQALVANGLRGRVRLETDGQLRTGRDVAIAAALGAEEFGFATAALVAAGCILMRACHLNSCPVGIATQDPLLRARFEGKPEHIERMMMFIAEEVREILASLGLRTLDALVGRADLLRSKATLHAKARTLDLSPLLHRVMAPPGAAERFREGQPDWLGHSFDRAFLDVAARALAGERQKVAISVRNTDRTIGTQLSSIITRERGLEGLPDGQLTFELTGVAGQSIGAFLAKGMTIVLRGQANDYFGKGLSGGRLVVMPQEPPLEAKAGQLCVGNVALYGATGGEAFLCGRAGERFAVRNSGATAVVEGVGDHGCEYMTGGTVIVLGPVGRNFAAGMSGGVAYVYDPESSLDHRINRELVDVGPLPAEDEARVRALLHRYVEHTQSPLGWRILSGWAETSQWIRRVIPTEFRAVWEKIAREQQQRAHAR